MKAFTFWKAVIVDQQGFLERYRTLRDTLTAHFTHREHVDRSIMNSQIDHREQSEAIPLRSLALLGMTFWVGLPRTLRLS